MYFNCKLYNYAADLYMRPDRISGFVICWLKKADI